MFYDAALHVAGVRLFCRGVMTDIATVAIRVQVAVSNSSRTALRCSLNYNVLPHLICVRSTSNTEQCTAKVARVVLSVEGGLLLAGSTSVPLREVAYVHCSSGTECFGLVWFGLVVAR